MLEDREVLRQLSNRVGALEARRAMAVYAKPESKQAIAVKAADPPDVTIVVPPPAARAWDFEIQRDDDGLMTRVIARPLEDANV